MQVQLLLPAPRLNTFGTFPNDIYIELTRNRKFFVIAPSSRKNGVFMLNIITTEVPIEDEIKERIETNENDYLI